MIAVELDGPNLFYLGEELDDIIMGRKEKQRVTEVEWDDDNQCWYVKSISAGNIVATGFNTRKDALDWEHDSFSPNGKYWDHSKNVINKA